MLSLQLNHHRPKASKKAVTAFRRTSTTKTMRIQEGKMLSALPHRSRDESTRRSWRRRSRGKPRGGSTRRRLRRRGEKRMERGQAGWGRKTQPAETRAHHWPTAKRSRRGPPPSITPLSSARGLPRQGTTKPRKKKEATKKTASSSH